MSVPQPFPYQGSKRKIAHKIISLFPDNVDRLIEPFVGSGAVSLRAAYTTQANRFVFNDVNVPLMALWEQIINHPERIAYQYKELWEAQQGKEKERYFLIRDEFNQTHRPDHLLYLLARCVKAAVRYNAEGAFNQSPDNRRKGMHPARMKKNILQTSLLLQGKTLLHALDYRQVLDLAQPADIVYMDPPYQGVCKERDPRYFQGLLFEEFVETLQELNERHISYMVSYDGRTGAKVYGRPLPQTLALRMMELNAGRSTQATLLGRHKTTFESLYLSPALCGRIDIENRPRDMHQLSLWS